MIITKLQQFIIFNCDQAQITIPSSLSAKVSKITKINPPTGSSLVTWSDGAPVQQLNLLDPNTIYLVTSKEGQLGYEFPGAIDPINYCNGNFINITASSVNNSLGFPCSNGIVCPGNEDCCGFSGQLEYEGFGEQNLIHFQSKNVNSVISFKRQYSLDGFQANLVEDSNIVTVSNKSIEQINLGQSLIKTNGVGEFGENAYILSKVPGTNRFIASVVHKKGGSIVFATPSTLISGEPKTLELRLVDGSYYGIITNSYNNYSGDFTIYDGGIVYKGKMTPDSGKEYSTIRSGL
jgi:hypothetical protein